MRTDKGKFFIENNSRMDAHKMLNNYVCSLFLCEWAKEASLHIHINDIKEHFNEIEFIEFLICNIIDVISRC